MKRRNYMGLLHGCDCPDHNDCDCPDHSLGQIPMPLPNGGVVPPGGLVTPPAPIEDPPFDPKGEPIVSNDLEPDVAEVIPTKMKALPMISGLLYAGFLMGVFQWSWENRFKKRQKAYG